MKLKNWNYIRLSFSAIVQAVLITILSLPWLQLASLYWQFNQIFASFWVFATVLTSIFFVKRLSKKKKEGLTDIIFGLLIPMVGAALLHLNIFVFVPLTLVLFLSGFRFNDYPSKAKFGLDWALGSMLLIVFSSLEIALDFKVSLASVLLFFALGIANMILWNAVALQESGLQPDYRNLGRSIFIFVVVVGGVSLGLGLLFSPAFFEGFMYVLQRIYFFIADAIILLLVRPFAWILSPLFRWVENLELQERKLELPSEGAFEAEQLARPNTDLSPQAMQVITGFGWFIFIAILLIVLWVVVRRFLRRPEREPLGQIRETRESVFSGVEILKDLKSVLKGIFKPISRFGQNKWYKGDNSLLLIRTIYARFIVKFRKKVPLIKSSTPAEYELYLDEMELDINQAAVHNLTELYNLARYGEIGDENAAKAADKAFRDL